MHDAKNRALSRGDLVLIPCVIQEIRPSEDFCNVSLETLEGRRPDGAKEHIYAINTGVLFRANEEDDNSDLLLRIPPTHQENADEGK